MISYDPATRLFHIPTASMSYVFRAGDYLQNLYWGKALAAEDLADLPAASFHSSFDYDTLLEREEYGCWTGRSYSEPCLAIASQRGRHLTMRFAGHDLSPEREGVQTLRVFLSGNDGALSVTLEYEVHASYDIVSRSTTITNHGEPVMLENAMSAALHLPQLPHYSLRYLTGKWAGEFQMTDLPVETGAFTIQSKRGITGPHFNPCFALSEAATEREGEVWFGLLAYSGNWKITVEKTIFNNVKIVGGVNDFDFAYPLGRGESFTTPAFLFGYAEAGFGGMSRKLHRFERDRVLSASAKPRRVLYNSWEATAFAVDVREQKKLADKAAQMGVELFVVDDGWFGERHSDKAGLGDWHANGEKFPNGLGELIGHVNGLGMDFGIWVEPEAVNPDSELYRKHPDWIYRFDGSEPLQLRNQYVLNITKPPVRRYIQEMLHGLLRSGNIRFLKWDMNRSISDLGEGGGAKDRRLWVEHVHALYEIWSELRRDHPDVELETCAGGGGRIDLGILRYAAQCWPSDNTDPFDRLFIQHGFTQFYAPQIMMCWVTDTPSGAGKASRSIAYKFHSAMCGGLGIGADINRLSSEEAAEYKRHILQYKEIRETILRGDLFRLRPPGESGLTAVEYVGPSGDEIVVLAFLHTQQYGDSCPRLKLQGLLENARYELAGDGKQYHGSTLMNYGLPVDLKGDFDSVMFILRKKE